MRFSPRSWQTSSFERTSCGAVHEYSVLWRQICEWNENGASKWCNVVNSS